MKQTCDQPCIGNRSCDGQSGTGGLTPLHVVEKAREREIKEGSQLGMWGLTPQRIVERGWGGIRDGSQLFKSLGITGSRINL